MWLKDLIQLRSVRGATSMLSHLCCPLYNCLSEDAKVADVMCWGMYVKCSGEVPGTLWRSHWAPRTGDPGSLLQSGGSQNGVASVTKQSHPELATAVSKMLPALVETAVSSTEWEIWVALLFTDLFSLSCYYIFFFWACPSLYLLPVSWEPVTQMPIRWVTLKAPYELVRPQKV